MLMYPFEGRFVHEGVGRAHGLPHRPDPPHYVFAGNERLRLRAAVRPTHTHRRCRGDQPVGYRQLLKDIQASINSTEMARRKFRDIAAISGLVFKGYPGKPVKDRHLQSSSQLFFNVFHDYEAHNLLLLQAYERGDGFSTGGGPLAPRPESHQQTENHDHAPRRAHALLRSPLW